MKKIEFPIITEKTGPYYPIDNLCAGCGEEIKNYEFYVINAGALEKTSEKGAHISNKLTGHFSIGYHAPYPDIGDKDDYSVDIIEHSANGQFDIHVCSIECLRAFFNQIVDEVERRDKQAVVDKINLDFNKKVILDILKPYYDNFSNEEIEIIYDNEESRLYCPCYKIPFILGEKLNAEIEMCLGPGSDSFGLEMQFNFDKLELNAVKKGKISNIIDCLNNILESDCFKNIPIFDNDIWYSFDYYIESAEEFNKNPDLSDCIDKFDKSILFFYKVLPFILQSIEEDISVEKFKTIAFDLKENLKL